MSTRNFVTPGIGAITKDALESAVRILKDITEVREGLKGDPLDASVTFRDLVDANLAKAGPAVLNRGARVLPVLNPGAFADGYDPVADLSIPPQPASVTASGGYETVLLSWSGVTHRNHAYAEIYRGTTNVIGDAIKVGQTSSDVFTDRPGLGVTRYYWVRFVTQANITGAFHATSGVLAATSIDVAATKSALTGQIGYSQLDTALNQQNAVKVDSNGYISGYGLLNTAYNGTPTSSFVIRADNFLIANPGGPGIAPVVPFIVRTTATTINGVSVPVGVYMDGAYIQNGSITNAKIGTASIDSAKIASVSADKLTAGAMQVGSYIESQTYTSSGGTQGWRINSDGTATFNNVVARGNINATSGSIIGATIATATSGQRIQLDTQGLLFLTGASSGKYGSFKYGAKKYGSGVLVYFNNTSKRVPFYVSAEQNVADIHLYNRGANPTGGAYEAGDMICVNGRLRIYVPALGGWKTVALE